MERETNPLLKAVKDNDASTIQKLIDAGIDVEVKDKTGNTALMHAAYAGHAEIVKALIAAGASINAKNHSDRTALMYATSKGHIEIMVVLITGGAEVNVQDRTGWTPVIYATYKWYNTEAVNTLISYGAKVNTKNSKGRTALMLAAEQNDSATINALIAAKAKLNLQDKNGSTALMFAVERYYNAEPVSALIAAGAEVELQNNDGKTALMLATAWGVSPVTILITAGAKTNVQDKLGKTALMYAASIWYNIEIIQVLIEAGALLDLQDKSGGTALMYAAERGHATVVRALLDNRALVNQQNNNGTTALMFAALKGHPVMVNALIEAGADTTMQDNKGANTFVYASFNKETLEFLLGKLSTKKRLDTAIAALKTILRQPKYFKLFNVSTSTSINNLVAYITKQHKDMQEDWDRFMLAAYLGDEDLVTYFSDKEEKAKVLTKADRNGDNYIVIAAKAGNLEFVEHMLMHEFNVHRANKKLLTNTIHKLSSLADEGSPLAVLVKEMQAILDALPEKPANASSPVTISERKAYTPAADTAATCPVFQVAGGAGTCAKPEPDTNQKLSNS